MPALNEPVPNMKIESGKVVSIDYKLTDNAGTVLDQSDKEPLAYLHGKGNIISGLEEALEGKSSGDSLSVTIAPEKAYGVRDENKVMTVPREELKDVSEVKVGMQFQVQTPSGPALLTVAEVAPTTVKLDANHPLAGTTLNFDVTIRDIREASAEEMDHGHVHGAGGHQH